MLNRLIKALGWSRGAMIAAALAAAIADVPHAFAANAPA